MLGKQITAPATVGPVNCSLLTILYEDTCRRKRAHVLLRDLMSRSLVRAFGTVVVLWVVVRCAVVPTAEAWNYGHSQCPTGFANFGDSLTDTGNVANLYPFSAIAYSELNPYGETFFGANAKRFCNGRVVPDFFSLAFGKPLLDAYFATTAFNYRYGMNFAVGGATAGLLATAVVEFPVTPFQTSCFIRLKNSAKNTTAEGPVCESFIPYLPQGDPYPDWLYTIEIGGNDILSSLAENVSTADIISTVIPHAIGNISIAVQTLYNESARNFLLFNLPAVGCSTIILTNLGGEGLPTDSLGCIVSINELASAFNTGLNLTIQGLRQKLPDASIALFDYYSANLQILENPTTYGFNPNLTTTACCGAPGLGSLNYNPKITCGHPELGSNNCANPDEYVNWDGIHFTENFYRTIAKFVLNGTFTDEGTNYTALCNLDFSKFGSNVTYQQAYPSTCNSLFG